MLPINRHLCIPDHEIRITPIRAQGPGGQNVNKVSNAVHLRFDIDASSLPDQYKQILRDYPDQRISKDGVINIKAAEHRSLPKNTSAARQRLAELIVAALKVPKKRVATRPSQNARRKRLESKRHRAQTKALRSRIEQ